DPAGDATILQARHVDVMAVLLEGLPRALVPHHLEAAPDDGALRPPIGAGVLRRLTAGGEIAVGLPALVIVLRLLIGACLRLGPALERRQTLAFPAELIDAVDAVLMEVARARRRRRRAIRNGRGER